MGASGDEIELKAWTRIIPGQGCEVKEPTLTWTNLEYSVERTSIDKIISRVMGEKNIADSKTILKGVNGQFKCGEMTALMGPSGAGKSTLLECLIGRRSVGLTGQIRCRNFSRVKVAFIPQNDHFFAVLTVREAIILASKLQNSTLALQGPNEAKVSTANTESGNAPTLNMSEPQFHESLANKIMEQLGLTVCADSRISTCSGGQKKRLAIAQELVSMPNVLVLDEPTSGLDSSACLSVCELLQKLSSDDKTKIAVIVTIHQPSYRVLSLFDKVYMLSNQTGKCIFEGKPTEIVENLAQFDLQCLEFENPSDYLVEVASGEYGQEVLKKLSHSQEEAFRTQVEATFTSGGESFRELTRPPLFPFFIHFRLLLVRSLLIGLRDPWLCGLRIASMTIVSTWIGFLFGHQVGLTGGCPPQIANNFEPSEFESIQSRIRAETVQTTGNMGCIFFTVIFVSFTGMMPTVITFPMEMSAFLKESGNQWYGLSTYYLSRSLADLPFQLVFPFMFTIIHFYMNGEGTDVWRFFVYSLIMVLVSLLAQSQGMLVGCLLVESPQAAVFLSPISLMAMMIFAGFFIRMISLSNIFVLASYITYIRFTLEAAFITLYGFDRCGENTTETIIVAKTSLNTWMASMMAPTFVDSSQPMVDMANTTFDIAKAAKDFSEGVLNQLVGGFVAEDGQVRSSVLNSFNLSDGDFTPNLLIMLIQLLIYKLAAYFVMFKKVNSKK